MKTLVQLLVVAALGYAFWVYGLPWVQRQAGQARAPVSSPARGAGGSCVQAAALASDQLHDDLLDSARALMDEARWDEIVAGVESSLQNARHQCGCKLESCVTARKALDTLDGVLSSARVRVRSSQSIPLELGRRYEQANQELWDAYDLARDGR